MSDSVAQATEKVSKAATKDFEMIFITTPEKAADTIFHAVKHDKRRVLVGPDAKVYDGGPFDANRLSKDDDDCGEVE
ncbi:MAG: hypothetical protein VX875_10065 [Pseudomonadota bacterium]|nr:hypothetical protein [Pseudomonadota bacterium]